MARARPASTLLASTLSLATALTPALAQPPAPAAGACVARDPVTAEINAREGIRLAKDEQFEAAEALFLTATRLDPCMPKYPYLLGRAHDRQDAYEEAAAAYQTVIDRFPTSVEFTKAQGALIKLRARQAAAQKAAEQAALEAEAARKAEQAAREAEMRRAAEEAARRDAQARADAARTAAPADGVQGEARVDDVPWAAVGWLSAGLGVAALGAGVGFSLAAQEADEELELAASRPDRARYDALVDERQTYSTLGYAGYGVGAALIIGGLTLVLVDEAPAPTVAPTEGGAVMGLTGRF